MRKKGVFNKSRPQREPGEKKDENKKKRGSNSLITRRQALLGLSESYFQLSNSITIRWPDASLGNVVAFLSPASSNS